MSFEEGLEERRVISAWMAGERLLDAREGRAGCSVFVDEGLSSWVIRERAAARSEGDGSVSM